MTVVAENSEERLGDLERAGEWASRPVLEDMAATGLASNAATEDSPAVEGEVSLGVRFGKVAKHDKKPVKHLLRLDAELNYRIESVMDHIPRLSKHRLIILAVEDYVAKIERAITKARSST